MTKLEFTRATKRWVEAVLASSLSEVAVVEASTRSAVSFYNRITTVKFPSLRHSRATIRSDCRESVSQCMLYPRICLQFRDRILQAVSAVKIVKFQTSESLLSSFMHVY